MAKDEMEGGFEDPLHPKVQWPPPALCPACRLGGGATDGGGGVGSGSDWDEGETLKFLKRYYGAGPGEGDAAGGAGRWHMQGHRKASFDRCAGLVGGCHHEFACIILASAESVNRMSSLPEDI